MALRIKSKENSLLRHKFCNWNYIRTFQCRGKGHTSEQLSMFNAKQNNLKIITILLTIILAAFYELLLVGIWIREIFHIFDTNTYGDKLYNKTKNETYTLCRFLFLVLLLLSSFLYSTVCPNSSGQNGGDPVAPASHLRTAARSLRCII